MSLFFSSGVYTAKDVTEASGTPAPSFAETAQANHLVEVGDSDAILIAEDTWESASLVRIIFYANTPYELHRYDAQNNSLPLRNSKNTSFQYIVKTNAADPAFGDICEQIVVNGVVYFERKLMIIRLSEAQLVLTTLNKQPPAFRETPNYLPQANDARTNWWDIKMNMWFKSIPQCEAETGIHRNTIRYKIKRGIIAAFQKNRDVLVPRIAMDIAMDNDYEL